MSKDWTPGSLCTSGCSKGHHVHLCQLSSCRQAFEAKRSDGKFCSPSHGARFAAEQTPERGCAHSGCPNLAMPGLASGYCQSHHRRSLGGKSMDAPLKGRPAPGQSPEQARQCVVDGCEELRDTKGFCEFHARWQGEAPERECSWWNCQEPAKRDGKCDLHYGGRGSGQRKAGIEFCSVVDPDGTRCEELIVGRGLCSAHYARWSKAGDPGPVARLKRKNGEGYVDPNGYIQVQRGGVKRLQHQWVMEEMLGVPLDTVNFEIHHKNGLRSDNRPENLELKWVGHGAGQNLEDLVAFIVANDLDVLYRRDGDCSNFPAWAQNGRGS